MSIEQLYQLYLDYPSVQTDTRKLRNGDLFFALKGPNFNGNEFVSEAFDRGAVYAIVDEQIKVDNDNVIVVEDVLSTLQQLALHHRKTFNIPFIAITGSNGKTTTKELVHAVLSTTYNCYTTRGNLNNHIGIPLTILSVERDANIAIIEMGANHQHEIEEYCKYTMPTHGLITNCGKAHLEGFGGEEGVKKAKGELFDYLRNNEGTVFIMNDYDYLVDMSRGIKKVVTYGTSSADTLAKLGNSHPYLSVMINDEVDAIETKLVGEYNLPNVLAAVAIGNHFKVAQAKIKEAIESYEPSNSRSQLVQFYSNYIILDAYNANPSSMKAAIENLASMQVEKKILILGAMAELGPESKVEHQRIIDLIQKYQWHKVVLVGGDFQQIDHPFIKFDTSMEANDWFASQEFEDSYILVKGSRSTAMEKVIEG